MRILGKANRRVSVVVYLVGAFSVCIVALGALMAQTTASSFARERKRTAAELKAVAQVSAEQAGGSSEETLMFVGKIAEQPELRSLDAAQCRAALGAFGGLLATPAAAGHIEVYRQDRSLVCGITPPNTAPPAAPAGGWFDRALATKTFVDAGIALDPIVGKPASTMAIPIQGTKGRTGVMAITFATGSWDAALPAGANKEMVVIQLDPARKLVLSVAGKSSLQPGPVTTAWMSKPLAHGTLAVKGADGVSRIYSEVTASNGWHVLAGLPKSVALKPAQAELQRNLLLGLGVVLLVAGLGFILERRLARPVRRLREAIEAASHDSEARAPVDGPSEIAAVAEAFNETIEERRRLELQLSHQALHDPLTGLPNRALLDDRLAQALARRDRNGRSNLAVVFFDVDRFKVINDSYGHERGDQVLVAVGERLVAALRKGDTVARFGGDEFVVLAENIRNDEDALQFATRLQEEMQRPIALPDGENHVTVTAGIALAMPTSTAGELLRDADAAMYRGKERRRGSVEIFDEKLGARARKRADTESALRRGLERGELVVHYQPEVEITTGQMTGVEALVRWNRPRHGMVPPIDFIPVAEETGLILQLGDFVLEEACRQHVEWKGQGVDLTVSVNLAPRQLTDPELPARVEKILKRTGAPATQLVLEMTESALVEDDPRTMAVLDGLKKLGVRLALDDFGTGYASLSYLRHFPVDVVKVDRSFVSDLGRNGGSAIVAAVVAMSDSLGLATVAEGVEDSTQLGALERMGCAFAQGFYLAKPQAPDTIAALAGKNLRRSRRKATTA